MSKPLAVKENRYFQQSWGIDELLELESYLPEKYERSTAAGTARYSNQWTDFKDTYMAKAIHTNLMCLEAASRSTSAGARPTDFRTRMIESFDLPGLLQNVKKIWRYRKNIWRLKTRTQDPSHAGPMYDLASGCAAAQRLRTAGGNLAAVPGLRRPSTTSLGWTRTRRWRWRRSTKTFGFAGCTCSTATAERGTRTTCTTRRRPSCRR